MWSLNVRLAAGSVGRRELNALTVSVISTKHLESQLPSAHHTCAGHTSTEHTSASA